MKSISFLSLFFFIVAGCNSGKDQPGISTADSTIQPEVQTVSPKTDSVTGNTDISKDTLVNLDLAGSNDISFRSRLGRTGPNIIYNFSISKPQSLIAEIVPDKTGCNVRFNQVIMPGNKADGPFGMQLKYKLPRKGKYQLIVGHNMMAGDPEICDFTLKVKLQ